MTEEKWGKIQNRVKSGCNGEGLGRAGDSDEVEMKKPPESEERGGGPWQQKGSGRSSHESGLHRRALLTTRPKKGRKGICTFEAQNDRQHLT